MHPSWVRQIKYTCAWVISLSAPQHHTDLSNAWIISLHCSSPKPANSCITARAKPAPLPSDSQDFFQKKHLYVQPKARQANVFASCFAFSFISFQYFFCTSSFSHSPITLQASPSTIPASLISHLPRPHFSSNTLLPKSIVISIHLLNPSASR